MKNIAWENHLRVEERESGFGSQQTKLASAGNANSQLSSKSFKRVVRSPRRGEPRVTGKAVDAIKEKPCACEKKRVARQYAPSAVEQDIGIRPWLVDWPFVR